MLVLQAARCARRGRESGACLRPVRALACACRAADSSQDFFGPKVLDARVLSRASCRAREPAACCGRGDAAPTARRVARVMRRAFFWSATCGLERRRQGFVPNNVSLARNPPWRTADLCRMSSLQQAAAQEPSSVPSLALGPTRAPQRVLVCAGQYTGNVGEGCANWTHAAPWLYMCRNLCSFDDVGLETCP